MSYSSLGTAGWWLQVSVSWQHRSCLFKQSQSDELLTVSKGGFWPCVCWDTLGQGSYDSAGVWLCLLWYIFPCHRLEKVVRGKTKRGFQRVSESEALSKQKFYQFDWPYLEREVAELLPLLFFFFFLEQSLGRNIVRASTIYTVSNGFIFPFVLSTALVL